MATVSSSWRRVTPSFSATAKPCRISSAASPSRWMPTTRSSSPTQTSLNRLRCSERASACSIGRKSAVCTFTASPWRSRARSSLRPTVASGGRENTTVATCS